MKARIEWTGEARFLGVADSGHRVTMDGPPEHGGRNQGPRPMELLLLGMGGCMSFDVVHILRKMRCEVAHYEIEAEGTRNMTPPQYYTSFDFMIHISGTGITPKKIDRAIELSQKKYCSVYHSLRPDIQVNVKYEIE